MNIRKLQKGLKYRGQVAGVRQTYHVFEASDYFFILSFALSKERRGSGYFNVINTAAVEYVQGRFAGRSGVNCERRGVGRPAHQACRNKPNSTQYTVCPGGIRSGDNPADRRT